MSKLLFFPSRSEPDPYERSAKLAAELDSLRGFLAGLREPKAEQPIDELRLHRLLTRLGVRQPRETA